ncbi:glutamate receptor ionotropic, kainate 4 isoform X1 [Diorhabda carinulata]|uniref:glutamate receptor ionotropic, kainate 4 isoform X1 n=1 Tax=Diorhabda carinulata TaxID=1163345 RepID=UPI0025A07293|nr:glutamate receptor ionotropic, kainate 4 isoform X1 [Diorhabda carinulata]
MGLAEFVITSLCLNATCNLEDFSTGTSTYNHNRIAKLEEDLAKETLIITTLENGELSGYENKNGSVIGTGIAFDIMNIIKQKYKFNYTIILPQENVFLGDSSKTTIKDMLENKALDIAVAFLPILNGLRSSITFSTSFDLAQWSVLMNRPQDSAAGSGLLAPFTTEVWILIIFSILIVGPIIYLIVLIQSRLYKEGERESYSLSTCLWFVYGALLKQGSTVNPRRDSSRLLFSTWWLFILILTAFYTANLTAFLTLSKFTLPIKSAKDIGRNHHQWVTNKANAIRDQIIAERNDKTIYRETLMDVIGTQRVFATERDRDILNTFVRKRKMMFIRETTVLKHVLYNDYKEKASRGVDENERCTYVVAKFPIINFSTAFAYSREFKYQELFDLSIQRLIEGGIIEFKFKENLPDAEICPLDLGSKERKLRNADLLLTYIIVGGGLAVAGCVFLMEILWRQWKTKCSKKRHKPRRNWHNNNNKTFNDVSKSRITPPPSYQTLFKPPFSYIGEGGYKKQINGRDYWIVNTKDGLTQMIPQRTPSALLFQFSN